MNKVLKCVAEANFSNKTIYEPEIWNLNIFASYYPSPNVNTPMGKLVQGTCLQKSPMD